MLLVGGVAQLERVEFVGKVVVEGLDTIVLRVQDEDLSGVLEGLGVGGFGFRVAFLRLEYIAKFLERTGCQSASVLAVWVDGQCLLGVLEGLGVGGFGFRVAFLLLEHIAKV